MTDADLKTIYIGDSVYASVDSGVICVFLNNGEREAPILIKRKSPIYLEPEEAIRLAQYINDQLQS
jgi:hypothetical protein